MKRRLLDLLAGADMLVARLARAAIAWLVWPGLIGVSAGAGLWALTHKSRVALLDTNKLTEKEYTTALYWVIGTTAAIGLISTGVAILRRIKKTPNTPAGAGSDLLARLTPLASFSFVAALALPNIEQASPKQTMFFIFIAAVLCMVGAYAWAPSKAVTAKDDETPDDGGKPPSKALKRAAMIGAALGVALVWAAYGWIFSKLSITNHHALNSRTTDLGYYDNIFYQSIHGHPLGCSFVKAGYHGSAHFDPILILLSPIYLISQHAETLLVLQSIWLGAGVVPVYLLARLRGMSRPGAVALAACYAAYPALHGANMYEFHSLSLFATVALWLFYFAETDRRLAYWLTIIPALLCREDIPLILCFFSVYLILTGKPGRARMGWLTIIVSLAYFVVVKRFFMTSSDIFMSGKDSYSYAYYYEDLIPNHNGVGGMLLSLLGNPAFAVKTMFLEGKIHYLLVLFMPLLFLPFLAKKGRVTLVYGILFCTLATRAPVFQPHFQYSCILLPFAFAITPMTLERIRESGTIRFAGLDGRRLAQACLVGCVVASALVSWKFGGIVDNQSFRGGFGRVTRTLSDAEKTTYEWIRKQSDSIPRSAKVGTTNKLGPHVSNRMTAYFWPGRTDVDWVFIDETELNPQDLERSNKTIQQGFVEVARNGRMVLAKRK